MTFEPDAAKDKNKITGREQPGPDDQRPHTPLPSSEHHGPKAANDTNGQNKHWLEYATAGFALIAALGSISAAVVGFWQWGIMNGQLFEMRRSSNDNEALQRAELTLSHVEANYYGERSEGHLIWHLRPVWENTGSTTAEHLTIFVHHAGLSPSDKYEFPDFSKVHPISSFLAAHKTVLGYEHQIQGEYLNTVAGGKFQIYITGIASYDDIFQVRHVTMTCVSLVSIPKIDFTAETGAQNISADVRQCGEYNCEDEQCLKYRTLPGIPDGVFPIGRLSK